MSSSTKTERALITGASGGLGAALAETLAARGVEVWLGARRQDALEAQARAIEARGGRAHVCPMDLARADEAAALVERLDDEVGGLDLLVANAAVAGAPAAIPTERLTWPNVRDLLQVNVMGTIATIVPLIPRMLERGRGHIVGISSIAALAPIPRAAPYGASKAALSHFLEAIGIELRPRGVAVTLVQPGFMRTPAQETLEAPMPFMLELPDAAARIDAAIRRRARTVTFPWPLATAQVFPRLLPAAVGEPLVRWVTRERPHEP